MSKRNIKKRYWAFVLYPESAPDDWLDQLEMSGLPIAISPYHEYDVNPTGELKKPHYHIILAYDGPTTYTNVCRLTDSLNQPIPQPLEAIGGYYRYLTHKDNPDKYQYDVDDIRHLNGFSIFNFVEIAKGEVIDIKQQLIDLIDSQDIFEYAAFVRFVSDNLSRTEFDVASSHTIFFNTYLKSRRYAARETQLQVVADLAKSNNNL